MDKELRILIVEDLPTDAELMERVLRKGGIRFRSEVVDTRDGFLKELGEFAPDIVLSDYALPRFDGMAALELTKDVAPKVPFIIVTGSVNEETAVECIKSGAADYVLKDGLVRLPSAVRAALEKRKQVEEREKAEEAVSRLASIVESSGDAIIGVSLAGTILSWNAGAEAVYGYPAQEAEGRSIGIIVPTELFDEVGRIFETVSRGERIVQYETVRMRKDGRRIEVSLTVSPIKDANGNITSASFIGRDITQRKQMEQALCLSEGRYRGIVETASEGVWIIDEDGKTTFVNQRIADMLGFATDEMIGKTVFDFVGEAEQAVAQQYVERRRQGISERQDLKLRCKDGSQLWTTISASPFFDQAGRYTGDLSMVSDITERKRAEEVLREKNALVELLQAVAVAANEASSVEGALQTTLDQVCSYTGWPVGHVYILDSTGELAPSGIWHLESPERFEAFRNVTDARRFAPGVGLPGRVLASGEPAWIVDVTKDSNFPRAKAAKEILVKGAFGFPVLVGKEVVAVLEFFSEERHDPDEALLQVMWHVGTQLGRVVERKRAEDSLIESESRLREAQSIAHLGSWHWEIASDRVTWADELYRIFGIEPQDFGATRESYFACVHPDDRERVGKDVEHTLSTHEPFEHDYRIVTPSGETRWLNGRGQVVLSPSGALLALQGTCEDITRRKQIEEALRENEERVRLIIDSSYDAFIAIDAGGFITHWNPQAEETFGWFREEAVGRILAETIIPVQYREAHSKGLKHFLETGEGPVLNKRIEITAMHRFGHEFPVELTISPVRWGDSFIFSAFVHDITERKNREEEVREMSSALENAVEGISRMDIEGRYIAVNRAYAAIAGYTPEELIGKNWQQTVHADDHQKMMEVYERMRKDGKAEAEARAVRKDGSSFYKHVVMVSAYDHEHAFVGHHCFMKDITERKRAEEALARQAQELARTNAELESFNRLAVGRESRMIELKRQVNELSEALGKEPPYDLSFTGEAA